MLLNEALKVVGAKLAKAERRLAAEPTSINRKLARDKLAARLEGLIAQAHAGKVYEIVERSKRPSIKGIEGNFNSSPLRSI